VSVWHSSTINAVRDQRDVITAADLDLARDRLLIGRRDASNALLPEEKHAVAVHEAGHALVAVLSEHADPVAKVTILPRGAALGVTEQLPESERHLYPQSYLTDSLAVRLGGRAAEIIVPGEPSTGASNDLAATTPSPAAPTPKRPNAPSTRRWPAYSERPRPGRPSSSGKISPPLHRVIDLLLERETINGSDLASIVGIPEGHSGQERIWAPRAVAMSPAQAGPHKE
jgi:cell division protease FtsH